MKIVMVIAGNNVVLNQLCLIGFFKSQFYYCSRNKSVGIELSMKITGVSKNEIATVLQFTSIALLEWKL